MVKSDQMRKLLEECKIQEYNWDIAEFRQAEMRVSGDYTYLQEVIDARD